MELFFLPGVDASHVYVRALALGCFYSHISTRTFRRALTASLHGQLRGDKRVPLQWRNYIWQSLEEGAGKRCWECGREVNITEKTSPAVELRDRLQRMAAIFRTSRKRCPADATDVLLQRQSLVKMNPEIFFTDGQKRILFPPIYANSLPTKPRHYGNDNNNK